jgi:hypothetical protein
MGKKMTFEKGDTHAIPFGVDIKFKVAPERRLYHPSFIMPSLARYHPDLIPPEARFPGL